MPMPNSQKNHQFGIENQGNIPLFWSNSTGYVFWFGDVKKGNDYDKNKWLSNHASER